MKINPLAPKAYVGARVPQEVRRVLEALALQQERRLGQYLCEVLTLHAKKHASKVNGETEAA